MAVTAVLIGAYILTPVRAKADISANATFGNKYLLSVGGVIEKKPVFQPSVLLSKKGIYFNPWLNVNLPDMRVSEIDYTLGYGRSIEGLALDISYNFFDLQNLGEGRANDNLHEIWLSISRPGIVSPRIKFAQNLSGGTFPHSRGRYVELGLNYEMGIGRIPLTLDGCVHRRFGYFIKGSAWSIGQGSISMPFKAGKLSITPKMRVQRSLDSQFEDNHDFGISAGYNF